MDCIFRPLWKTSSYGNVSKLLPEQGKLPVLGYNIKGTHPLHQQPRSQLHRSKSRATSLPWRHLGLICSGAGSGPALAKCWCLQHRRCKENLSSSPPPLQSATRSAHVKKKKKKKAAFSQFPIIPRIKGREDYLLCCPLTAVGVIFETPL